MDKTTNRNQLITRLIAGYFLLCSSMAQAQETAGNVVFALGSPQATDVDGNTRTLARGDEVFTGDTMNTSARGRLQVAMLDGAYISVQPDSSYVINDYVYNGAPDGTENAEYELVKGGVRAVTGLIGRTRPEAYKVNTAVATIGIRGTGHNTRLCAGDCGDSADGLYHSTWEGITFVQNNVDLEEVPAGLGVYVQDLNSLIRFLTQMPGILAAQVQQSAEEEEEEQSTSGGGDEEPVFQQGEQVASASSSTKPLDDFLMALPVNIGTSSFFPVITGDFGSNETTGFFSELNEFIGVLFSYTGTEMSSTFMNEVRTIDFNAMANADDPESVEILSRIRNSGNIDDELLKLEEMPASVAEFSENETTGIGFGRWSNGYVLSVFENDEATTADLLELVDNQSVHFIYGPKPPAMLPSSGTATYNFFGGTQSTSLSGATIGDGVTSGTIELNFGTSLGSLDMDVNHNNNNYDINALVTASDVEFFVGSGSAMTSASGSACLSNCAFSLTGSFAGETDDGNPAFINFEYNVEETDPFFAIASFQFGSLTLDPLSTTMPLTDVIALSPDPEDMEFVGIDFFEDAIGFFNDSDQLIGIIGTDDDDENISFGDRLVATIDLNAISNSDNPTANAEVASIQATAPGVASAIDTFEMNPASVTDSNLTSDGLGWGRWTNGNVLSFDENESDVDQFTGFQSVHFIFGPAPPDLTGLSSTAFFDFIGGTQSTSVDGMTIGSGVTDGDITVFFGTSTANISMDINHGGEMYNLGSQPLTVDKAGETLFDSSTITIMSGPSGLCYPNCTMFIDGKFLGPTVMAAYPKYIGLEYDVQAGPQDTFGGVAGFEFVVP